jgi:hypothetical protein
MGRKKALPYQHVSEAIAIRATSNEYNDDEEARRETRLASQSIKIIMSSAQPSSSKRARRSGHKSGSQNNFHDLKCDSCNNSILSANNSDHHVQNTPCNHNICMLCVIKKNMRGGSSNQSACCCQVESCKKYITSCQYFRAGSPGEIIMNEGGDDHNNRMLPSFDDLGTDVVANIFGCLDPVDIMHARLNKKMREAAKKTIVPLDNFSIDSVDKYNAMAAMTTALPNLQQLTISYPGFGYKYIDGEDPDENRAAFTANWATHGLDILSRFSKLRILVISSAPLNGRYPLLFNFPLLQNLTIWNCHNLKCDLEVLAGLPSLTELQCEHNHGLTGNINNLRMLKNTLTKVQINRCRNIRGNFMDLADFPHLKEMNLRWTNVTGDIREVSERDFPALESLSLPSGVYGGQGHELQRISDAPDIISTLCSFKKQRPTLLKDWYGRLSQDSPDWFHGEEDDKGYGTVPIYIVFVQAGPRLGYRWETEHDVPIACEVNWLDPEPDRESSDYEKYTKELQEIERKVDIYRGFHQPPTEEEHDRHWSEREGRE